ncbi:MAG: GntR family transcriptional regulator [Candidatus Limiplasma sp.]|nr:GntR family transcriptional regulator [Candidatus Limiplasma sp.]
MKKSSLKVAAYQAIKERIVNCQYRPNTFLNEASISEELGMSRTPIREALGVLEQEKLVKIYAKRGALVTDISAAEVDDIFEVRLLVEPHIIVTHGSGIDQRKLLDIKYQLERQVLSGEEYNYDIDQDIHSLIIASSNNRYFETLMDNIYDQNHRLRILSGQKSGDRTVETVQEHIAIVDFLLKGEREQASEAMRMHLIKSRTAALEGLLTP